MPVHQGELRRDKLNASRISPFFADFRWFLQIFAVPGNYSTSETQIFADFRRKPQIFAENLRIPQIFAETRLVCPFQFLPSIHTRILLIGVPCVLKCLKKNDTRLWNTRLAWILARERQRGGAKRGGVQNLTRRPPTKNSFWPPSPRYILPQPPYSISLRNPQNFSWPPQKQLSEGVEKWFPTGHPGRGFAFRYVFTPPPFSTAQFGNRFPPPLTSRQDFSSALFE